MSHALPSGPPSRLRPARALLSAALAAFAVAGCAQNEPVSRPPAADGGGMDGGSIDAGVMDGGGMDGSGPDAAPTDGPEADGAPTDGPALDGGPVSMPCAAAGACDPFSATSCPSGQSCRSSAGGAWSCQPLAPSLSAIGAPCANAGDCPPTSACLDFGGGLRCERLCPRGSVGACGPAGTCSGTIGDACVQVCRPKPPRCDIYVQDCADPALACTLVTDAETSEPYTGCRSPGPRAVGETCGGADGACARGAICVREDGVARCHAVCRTDGAGPACARTGETCSGLARTWGVTYCRVP